jgi:uncharacterized membrane protein
MFPSLEWINWWHFHPDALIITPFLFAWWLATRKRWGWFSVAIVIALLCKEDAALGVGMMGIVLAVQGERRKGAWTAVAGFGWFLICTRVIISYANHGQGTFYEDFFPGFGTSLFAIVWTMVRHPSRVYRVAFVGDRLKYYRQLLYPTGLLALGNPLLLTMAFPQTLVNVLSGLPYTHQIRYHYSSVPTAVVFIATVDVFCRVVKRGERAKVFVVALMVVAAVLANREWSPSPISTQYKTGVWAANSPRQATLNEAVSLVHPSDGVTATYYFVPHLTHRVHIYEFPNPFRPANWGLHNVATANPDTTNVLVIDRGLTGEDEALFESLIAPDGPFRIEMDKDGIVVARRKAGR